MIDRIALQGQWRQRHPTGIIGDVKGSSPEKEARQSSGRFDEPGSRI